MINVITPVVRVSVIIPCYNREHLLGETLDSLLGQTYPHWEAIVVDDDSQDDSLGVAKRYARVDDRIRAVSRQGDRKGGNICRNQGLALAQGEYVLFLDSDDLLSPTCLAHRVAAMDNIPDCGFGVYQTELFTHAIGDRQVLWNAYTETKDLHRFLSMDTVWLTTGSIWRKQTVVQLGGFDEDVLNLQDWAIHVRALMAGIKYFKEPVWDNFHRLGYDSAATISAVSDSRADHLTSREKLFTKIFYDLQAAGLLDQEIRCRVAGMFWWLATLWRAQGNIHAADRIWQKAKSLGLCSRREYLEGRLILRLYSVRGGGRVARLIQRFWPPQFTQLFSKHLCKEPIARPEPDAASLHLPRTDAHSHQIQIKPTS